ncbi:Hypothetical protein I595_1432 [Croceitalea dokdonensis DOKDO 023]|uniref:Uncharacterized protein n=1 Tax=Croceitalea dokdonensis DOKDO 023 TaxID=1300341 RepID=A0A0P7AWD6_9FLAO|nr:Hypothetical protein I595_1432 [Croceitalea dokdonensis DOKDO 023]
MPIIPAPFPMKNVKIQDPIINVAHAILYEGKNAIRIFEKPM